MKRIYTIELKHFYAMVITMDPKIPEKILQHGPKLIMWYNRAATRAGGEV